MTVFGNISACMICKTSTRLRIGSRLIFGHTKTIFQDNAERHRNTNSSKLLNEAINSFKLISSGQ